MYDDVDIENAIEAVLFVSTDVLSIKKLCEIFDKDTEEIKGALLGLQKRYEVGPSGICLREIAGGWRLFSKSEYHEIIEKYVVSLDPRKLSNAALETLSIIAYSQPVTRAGIASVRGVSSDSSINSLIEKGLVKEVGFADIPGNPILYGTTNKFLENFGLGSVKDLPKIEDFAPDEKTKQFIFDRLDTTTVDQSNVQMKAFDKDDFSNIDLSSENIDSEQLVNDANAMFEQAIANASGVTEKIDFDNLQLNTDDE